MSLISRKSFQFCSSSTPTSRSLLMTLNKRLSFLCGQQKPENCNSIAMRMVCFKDRPRYMFWRKKHVQMQMQSLNETLHLCGDTGSPAKSNTAWRDEELFFKKLNSLCTSKEIFCFLSSLEVMSDTMASGALQRISEIEVDDSGLKNPEGVLENEIFRALCSQFEFESSKLSNTGLLNALQALVKLRIDPQSTLVASLLSQAEERLSKGQLSAENLCALGESMLELESPSYATLEQIMKHMQKKDIEKLSPREMVLVYRILQVIVREGKKQYQDLLNRMNNVTLTIVSQLSPKFTSIILNSLVILDQTQAVPLVTALCKHSVKHIPYFTGDELVDILDAFLYFGYHEQIFTEALETYVPKSIFTMHPQTVSKVMQYCCQKRILSKPIFDAVAESFISDGDRFTTDQIAGYIVPFGTLNYLSPSASSLFRKLETILHARLSQFQPHTLLNLLHSCVLIQRYPVNFLPKIFSPYFLQRLQAQPPGLDRIATSQLIHLFLTVTLECPFYEGPKLLPKYQVKGFLMPRSSLDVHLLKRVKTGLLHLLKKRMYFASEVSTPYFYVVDIEIKLDEEGFVLPAAQHEEVHRRIALCVDGQYRFCVNSQNRLGEEAIKQRHLQLLGYEVVQIPFFEIESLRNHREMAEYLHKKLSPLIHRDSAANRGE